MNAAVRSRGKRAAVHFLRRLLRWLDPSTFFNEDASREIDRLLIENDALRERLGGRA